MLAANMILSNRSILATSFCFITAHELYRKTQMSELFLKEICKVDQNHHYELINRFMKAKTYTWIQCINSHDPQLLDDNR